MKADLEEKQELLENPHLQDNQDQKEPSVPQVKEVKKVLMGHLDHLAHKDQLEIPGLQVLLAWKDMLDCQDWRLVLKILM